MKKKGKCLILFILIILFVTIFSFLGINYGPQYIENFTSEENELNEKEENANLETSKYSNTTTDNSTIIKTNSNATIRIINEYDASTFKGKKSILIMWGTWCSHCAATLQDNKDIVDYYKDTDINVYLISHDFEIQTLVDFLEKDTQFNFEEEIFLDLNRVIRKAIDPEANSVPIAYILDENLNILAKFDGGITLQESKDILEK